jgi:hypothetical protein
VDVSVIPFGAVEANEGEGDGDSLLLLPGCRHNRNLGGD